MTALTRCAFLLAALTVSAAHAADIDRTRIITHIKKQFSTPADLEMSIGELSPSPLKGYLAGELSFISRGQKSTRDIHVSNDGRYYFLAPIFKAEPSDIPGLITAKAPEGHSHTPPPPPVFLSEDGKYFFLGNGIAAPQDSSLNPDKINQEKINLKDAFGRGPTNAPVALVEYSDVQCPYCKVAHDLLKENLMKTYGEKVRWVSKHFPLRNIHPWSYDAALAITCGGQQSPKGFFAMQDAYFENQKKIKPEDFKEKTLEFAKKAGLNTKRFTRCLDKKESARLVDADIHEAEHLGVNSTPTIFINGRKLNGLDFPTIQALIDEMLAAKDKK